MARKTTRKTTTTRQAIGYVRVSTLGQAVDGVSLDAQREAITRQAEAAGLLLTGIEADEGISGKRADTRPGLQRAVEQASKGGHVLIVYSLSRLARSTSDTLHIAEQLERSGADLVSVSEKIDTSGACGRMMFRMLSVLAEFESDIISERVTIAAAQKRAKGESSVNSVSSDTPIGKVIRGVSHSRAFSSGSSRAAIVCGAIR
jgi:DNA invertase Pin-like site-specific DNA recombinase